MKVTVHEEIPLTRVVAQLGVTWPPSAVKFTTVPSSTALPWRSAKRAVSVVEVPSRFQPSMLNVPTERLI